MNAPSTKWSPAAAAAVVAGVSVIGSGGWEDECLCVSVIVQVYLGPEL